MADVWNEQTGIPGVDNAFDPMAFLRGQLGQAGVTGGPVAPGPTPTMVAPQVGSQIPGGGWGNLVPNPNITPPVQQSASNPNAFMPQLPQAGAPPPAPTPIRTPQVQYYPTKGGARTANILGALQGFREGAQNANATNNQQLYNIGKGALNSINSISQRTDLTDDQKKEKIGAIVNRPEVQQGLRLAGIELPMVGDSQQQNAPSGIKGVLGKVMSGLTGVPQKPPTGQVDVSALPQMNPANRLAALQAQQALEQAPVVAAYNKAKTDAMMELLPLEKKAQIAALGTGAAKNQALADILNGKDATVPDDVRKQITNHMLGIPQPSPEEKTYQEFKANPPEGYTGSRMDFDKWQAQMKQDVKPDPASVAKSRAIEIQSRLYQGLPVSAEDQAFYKAYNTVNTVGTRTTFQLQMGAGGNQPLNPKQQATAQAILDGRMAPPSSFALRTPYWQAIMGSVFEQDPQFSEQRAQLRKNYTVPTGNNAASQINAINTAMGHVGVLGQAIDALNNGNIVLLNQIGNQLGVQVGRDPVTTFNTIVHRVGPEITRAYVGTVAGENERRVTESDFDPKLGPAQLKSNVAMTAQLLRSKVSALANQWDQNKTDQMPSFQDRFIMPEAKRALDALAPVGSGGTSGVTVNYQGKPFTFPNQAAADSFKKDMGIK